MSDFTREYTLWCSRCQDWSRSCAQTQREAAKEFRQLGWKLRRGRWVCPGCLRTLQDFGTGLS